MRYAADFATLLFIVEAVVIAGLWQMSKPAWRLPFTATLVIFGLAGIGANAAIGLMGYSDGLDKSAPDQYAALVKTFQPVSSVLRSFGVKP